MLMGAAFGVVGLFLLLFLIRPEAKKASDLRAQQAVAEQQQAQLRSQLSRLQSLQKDEPRLRAELARMQDGLPTDPRLPDFILQVQEAAGLAGIDFLSISPSLPVPFSPPTVPGAAPAQSATGSTATGGQLQTIAINVSTTGKYFEVLDFIVRLERLRRVVRINTFSMAPGGSGTASTTSPVLSVTFALQMFVNSPVAAVAPGAAAPPGGSPTPAPGSTPAPGATPAPATLVPATPVPGG